MINDLQGQIDDINEDKQSIHEDINGINSNVASLFNKTAVNASDIKSLEQTDIGHNNRISTNEHDIADLKSTKLDKNQGKVHSGKTMMVDENGYVVPKASVEDSGLRAVSHDNSMDGAGTDKDPLRLAETISGNRTFKDGVKIKGSVEAETVVKTPKLNNGADISVPTVGGTLARTEDIDSKITNCITEIPQDVKLELADGVLKLKAGSIVYVPNGAGVFNKKTAKTDVTTPNLSGYPNGQYLVFDNSDLAGTSLRCNLISACYSGATAPATGAVWYDTTNNKIMVASGDTWTGGRTLPLGVITISNGTISSIDQVFNGFGYVGSTAFVLPGVKGLIPNGRNEDGTLKNIKANSYQIYTYTRTSATTPNIALTMAAGGYLEPSSIIIYNEETNIHTTSGTPTQRVVVGKISFGDGGKITSFEPKTAFHAVDYSDFETKQDKATALSHNNITNCITEIPQDIKIELSSAGQLKLLAGSKLYIPNGSGVFTEKTITSDITRAASLTTGQYVEVALFYKTTLNFVQLFEIALSKCCSGTTDTLAGQAQHLWYDTTNNLIKYYGSDGTTNSYYAAFPLCIISSNGTQISSIDQVFNGFGYVGSTIFALPGVKVLAPYGRNEDGSLKNYPWTASKVVVRTGTYTAVQGVTINCVNGSFGVGEYSYNSDENFNCISGAVSDRRCVIGKIVPSGDKIGSFIIKPAFHAVDYNDFEELDNSAVHKTGNETIGGVKTFNNTIRSKGSAITFEGISTSATQSFKDFDAYDDTGKAVGTIRIERNSTYGQSVNLISRKSDGSAGANLVVRTSPDGKYSLFTSVTPASSSNDTSIATTAWVRNWFEALYPVGSLYISTGNSCPLTSIVKKSDGSNSTWTLVAAGKSLWTGNGTTGDGTVRNTHITGANNTISAGLPNITGEFVAANSNAPAGSGAFTVKSTGDGKGWDGTAAMRSTYSFDATRSSSIYGNSTTVQPPAYVVNVWRRTA
jgi:hypothetical protein